MRPTAPGSVAWSTASRIRCFSLALKRRRFAFAALGTTCGSGIAAAGWLPFGTVEFHPVEND